MIEVKCINDVFYAKGTLDLGYMGVYENKDWRTRDDDSTDKLISLDTTPGRIRDCLEKKRALWNDLPPFLVGKELTCENIAQGLADYYNSQEDKMKRNRKQLNDTFLSYIFKNFFLGNAPFWYYTEFSKSQKTARISNEEVISMIYHKSKEDSDSIHDNSDEEIINMIYHKGAIQIITSHKDFFGELPNDGSIAKPDMETIIRNTFPMFDLDKLLNHIKPSLLLLSGGDMAFRLDDTLGAYILNRTYAEIQFNLAFRMWYNH